MGFAEVAKVITACRCHDLDPTAKLVLCAIAHHSDETGMAFPGMSTLAGMVNIDARNVRLHIRALTSSGYLRCVPGFGRTSSRYWLELDRLTSHVGTCKEAEGMPIAAPNWSSHPYPLKTGPNEDFERSPITPQNTRPYLVSPDIHDPLIDHRIDHRISLSPAQVVGPLPAAQTAAAKPRKEREREKSQRPPDRGQEAQAPPGPSPAPQSSPAAEAKPEPAEPLAQLEPVPRSDAEKRAAFDALTHEAGKKLSSARAMTRDQWQHWAAAWEASGGQIEDCRIVGRWMARGGLDWLKKPKSSYLATHWPECLAQALEDPKSRPSAPAKAPLSAVFGSWATEPPPEAIENLAKLGIHIGAKKP